jgi:hypothetical protein
VRQVISQRLRSSRQAMKETQIKPCEQSTFSTHQVRLCWLENRADTNPCEEVITIAEIAKRWTTPDTTRGRLSQAEYQALDKKDPVQKKIADREKNGEAFIPASFGTPGCRTADQVLHTHGFVLDLDGGVNRTEFEQKLSSLGYIAYTSYSHHPDDERWRVFIPYKVPCAPDDHAPVFAFFNAMFGIDQRSGTVNQLWYTPACPHDAGSQYQVLINDALLFDPYSVPALPVAKPSVAGAATRQPLAADHNPTHDMAVSAPEMRRLTSALGFIDADSRENWIKVGMALKNDMGDAALPVWLRWSANSNKFDEDDATSTWDGFGQRADGLTLGTVFHLAQQAGWTAGPSIGLASTQAANLPLFDIAEARIDAFLQTPPAPRRWVLQGLLPLGIVGALVGAGGSSKSQFLMQLAYSVATGVDLTGYWQVGEQGGVLMLCAEDPPEEVHRRVYRIHQQLGHFSNQAAIQRLTDRLYVQSLVGVEALLTHATQFGEVTRTPVLERLLLTARQVPNLKLLIIDPGSRFRGGDENANADATRFVQALEYLALELNVTVMIAHHTNKGAAGARETSQNDSRGASALTDGIRWQMALAPPKKGGDAGMPESERKLHVVAELVKTNYTAPKASVMLKRESDGYLQAVAAPVIQGAAAIAALLTIMAAEKNGITAGRLERDYGGLAGKLKMAGRPLRKVLAELRHQGMIEGDARKPLKPTAKAISTYGINVVSIDAARRGQRVSAARRKKIQ